MHFTFFLGSFLQHLHVVLQLEFLAEVHFEQGSCKKNILRNLFSLQPFMAKNLSVAKLFRENNPLLQNFTAWFLPLLDNQNCL